MATPSPSGRRSSLAWTTWRATKTCKPSWRPVVDEAHKLSAHYLGGEVKETKRYELGAKDWDPLTDRHLTVWEVTQHLVRTLDQGGETKAADLVSRIGGLAESAREPAYRLYSVCKRGV